MGIALYTTAKLLAPVQSLLRGCVVAAARRLNPQAAPIACKQPMVAPATLASVWPLQSAPALTGRVSSTHRPLRVVRVLEVVQGQRANGRMVISGSMVDVCAELDRLAAQEALCS
jgi:hypothetical protein